MGELVLPDLTEETVRRLQDRAQRHGRTLHSEIKAILEEATTAYSMEEASLVAAKWRQMLNDRQFEDSAAQIHEDRER